VNCCYECRVIQLDYIAAAFYEKRAAEHQCERERLARRSLHVSNLRGLTFVVFAGATGVAIFSHAGVVAWSLGLLGLGIFFVLVAKHSRIIAAEDLEDRWVRANRDAASRVTDGGWYGLSQTGEHFRNSEHAYSEDLDIFGKGSLFQRLNVAQTHLGQATLAEWLSAPANAREILERQRTIAALEKQVQIRQELEVLGLATREVSRKNNAFREPEDLEPFLAWAEEAAQPNLHKQALIAWGLPCATLLSALLAAYGLVPSTLVLLPLALCLWALSKARRRMSSLLRMLQTSERTVASAGNLFRLLEQNSELFGLSSFAATEAKPSVALASLSRIGGWFELRHNGLIYPFIDVAVLWDIHCWLAFERWRTQHGKLLRPWFAAIGRAEALSSLAGFGFDEPNCCFAELVDEDLGLEAVALGHPLIHPARRVANDLAALQSGHGLLVTGSNMSGKSTYLRAIGLGCVLGLAGAYVPAKKLCLKRTQIATSMRIRDDLSSGVSHFYAELQKLKRVIDATKQPLPLLFLLDEILHGTNSRERQIGARFIIAELLRNGAFGAVSTHDSALCELSGELASRLRLVHFRESMSAGEMTFDYRVHAGAVTAGNALRLMQKMGMNVPVADPPS